MTTVSVNTQFPGYEILGELGRGNARVLKARHIASGDLVAIKQFALNTDPDTLRRFQQESDIMTHINHPNVVKVREVRLDATMPYVVMEFVEGGDLRSLLRSQGGLALSMCIRLGLQMTEALRAIHRERIIHRDIKPENILYRRLVSGELHFLLTDFGIAKIRADESTRTRTGQSLLTYEYASPEQFDDPRNVGEPADYYALGVVLYEAVSGRVPFPIGDEAGLVAFMRQVLTANPPDVSLPAGQPLPPSLQTLLRDLLTKQPAERLHNPDDVELLLEQAKVEQLRANRPGFVEANPVPLAPRLANVTRQGPMPVASESDYFEEPAEELNAAGQSWWGIVLALVVTAVVLGFVWMNRTSRTNEIPQTSVSDSVVTASDSASSFTSDTTSESSDSEQTPEMVIDSTASQPNNVTDESATSSPGESTGEVVPDSANAEADSTQ